MKQHLNIYRHLSSIKPLLQSARVQTAVMSLRPGKSSSDSVENEHPRAEQWLLVLSGTGVAKVGRRQIRLAPGVLLLIAKNAAHQVTNTGRVRLITVNFYSPPAYTRVGSVRASVASERKK